jgi:GT2 family glycosyltransferase
VPCRNAPEVLWLTLTHLWAADVRYPITLLDNCSTAPGMDDVLAEARRRGAVVIRHEMNVGVWASVNRGLALARARWVWIVTSDVLLAPATLELLPKIAEEEQVSFLGPDWTHSLQALPILARRPTELVVQLGAYNGSCWLMDWPRLRAEIGWFDPGYYVAFGDTDYVERMRQAGMRFGVVRGLPSIHLDKQTRRHDHTADTDSEIESRDAARFHERWAAHPDVLARHPQFGVLTYTLQKEQAGWKELIPR